MKRPSGERQPQLKTRAVSRIASRNEPWPKARSFDAWNCWYSNVATVSKPR